jgi:hypothetical protein
VRREKCPDRGRAKRVAALRVRVDHAKSCSHPDRTTLSASNVAVTRVRKQSHQAHFSGENDWKLGKSGQKKIGTKIIGPKFAENRCRLCRKLPPCFSLLHAHSTTGRPRPCMPRPRDGNPFEHEESVRKIIRKNMLQLKHIF